MDGVDGLLFSSFFCLWAVVVVAVVAVVAVAGVFPKGWLIERVLLFFEERLFDGIGQLSMLSPAPLAQWQLAFRQQFPYSTHGEHSYVYYHIETNCTCVPFMGLVFS